MRLATVCQYSAPAIAGGFLTIRTGLAATKAALIWAQIDRVCTTEACRQHYTAKMTASTSTAIMYGSLLAGVVLFTYLYFKTIRKPDPMAKIA